MMLLNFGGGIKYMETKIYSTCQRRGYQLTDLNIWEVTRGREHLGYEKFGEPCDPPQYIQLDPNENERILPKDAVIIEKRFDKVSKGVINSGNVVEQVAALVEENERLKVKVKELETRKSGPDVELVDRWRLELSWYGSWHQLHQEWGFETKKEAENRLQHWIQTFGDKFDNVAIKPYKINREGL